MGSLPGLKTGKEIEWEIDDREPDPGTRRLLQLGLFWEEESRWTVENRCRVLWRLWNVSRRYASPTEQGQAGARGVGQQAPGTNRYDAGLQQLGLPLSCQ